MSCLRFDGSVIAARPSRSSLWRRSTRGRFARSGRRREASRKYRYRRIFPTSFSSGGRSVRKGTTRGSRVEVRQGQIWIAAIRPGGVHLSWPGSDRSWTRGNYRKRVCTSWLRTSAYRSSTSQVIRRTIATLARGRARSRMFRESCGIPVSQPRTDIYMQEIAEGVRATVRLHPRRARRHDEEAGRQGRPADSNDSIRASELARAKIVGDELEARGFRREANDDWHVRANQAN